MALQQVCDCQCHTGYAAKEADGPYAHDNNLGTSSMSFGQVYNLQQGHTQYTIGPAHPAFEVSVASSLNLGISDLSLVARCRSASSEAARQEPTLYCLNTIHTNSESPRRMTAELESVTDRKRIAHVATRNGRRHRILEEMQKHVRSPTLHTSCSSQT